MKMGGRLGYVYFYRITVPRYFAFPGLSDLRVVIYFTCGIKWSSNMVDMTFRSRYSTLIYSESAQTLTCEAAVQHGQTVYKYQARDRSKSTRAPKLERQTRPSGASSFLVVLTEDNCLKYEAFDHYNLSTTIPPSVGSSWMAVYLG
jgi:hypothetical protein